MTDPAVKVGQLTRNIRRSIAAPAAGTPVSSHPPVVYLIGTVSAVGVTSGGNPGWVTVDVPDSYGGGAATGSITMPSITCCLVGDTVLVAKMAKQYWIDQVIGRDFTIYQVATTPGYQNGWTDYDAGTAYGGVRYWQDSNGVGHIDGTAKNASSTTGTMFTLPAEWSPLYNTNMEVNTSTGPGRVLLLGLVSGTPGVLSLVAATATVSFACTFLIGG